MQALLSLAVAGISLIPPVNGPLSAHFEAPSTDWGPGHRGIDYAVPLGTAVAAAAEGTVSFAGRVGGTIAVTLDHGSGIETTYTDLSEVLVTEGEEVEAGRWIGRSGFTHPGARPGVHLGVKMDGDYVDPLGLMGPVGLGHSIRLAPASPWPPSDLPGWLTAGVDRVGTHVRSCEKDAAAPGPSAPNGNIAVAIAGIGSHTAPDLGAEIYGSGPELLGYPPERVYRFSYLGVEGPDLHQPYPVESTFGDLVAAAGRLEELLRAIRRRHPGAAVDLIAHSQGGIVARIYLEALADPFDPALPRIDHVITFASPHGGAPAADLPAGLVARGQGWITDAVSWASAHGLPIPDPRSQAIRQLSTGSSLIEWLATEDIVFGARALALSSPWDVVVPANRAQWPGEANAVIPADGLWAHGSIVSAEASRALAWGFLAGRAPVCPTAWDRLGPLTGRGIEGVTDLLPVVLGWVTGGPLSSLWAAAASRA